MRGKMIRADDVARIDGTVTCRTREAAATQQSDAGCLVQSCPVQSEEAGVIDLGRASERTRGSYTGFVIEQGAFPLRDF